MKKKILLCLLLLMGLFTITGCEKGKDTTIDIDGKKYSIDEIKKIKKSNEIEYNDSIRWKKVKFEGTIKKVKVIDNMTTCQCVNKKNEIKYMHFKSSNGNYYLESKYKIYEIIFEEGIHLNISQDSIDKDILKVGNKLKVESNISYVDDKEIVVETTNIEKDQCFEIMDEKYYNECYSGSKVTLK